MKGEAFWLNMPSYKEMLERQKIRRVNGPLTESAWFKLTKNWGELQPWLALYLTEWMKKNMMKLESEIWLLIYAPATKKVKGRQWLE